MKNIFGFISSAVVGVVAYLTGLHFAIKLLMLFMVIDFGLGIIKASINKELTSKKMFIGGIRKGTTFIVIIMAHYLAMLSKQEIVFTATIGYYIGMETLSVFEHVIDLDVSLPKFLIKLADYLKTSNDEVEI